MLGSMSEASQSSLSNAPTREGSYASSLDSLDNLSPTKRNPEDTVLHSSFRRLLEIRVSSTQMENVRPPFLVAMPLGGARPTTPHLTPLAATSPLSAATPTHTGAPASSPLR
uniref:Uncharacterized protein n=1 Tax=Calcidiscus leptoporus TaxID=127549 RepID=A0A7S0JKC4_9EUKA|mmetsp:Transcript_8329/g.19535  ORF Transcript_8329/g.19535 Transcript_8329/m.19535 type:complete len:112 (+) Transcript_8329:71-406(+)